MEVNFWREKKKIWRNIRKLKKKKNKKNEKKHWAKFRAFFFRNRHIYQISLVVRQQME
jgi:hypothetical protein